MTVLCSVVKLVGSDWNKKEVHFFQLTKRKAGKKVREMVFRRRGFAGDKFGG